MATVPLLWTVLERAPGSFAAAGLGAAGYGPEFAAAG